MFPELNTHIFLSQSIGWCGSPQRKLASHTKKHTNKVKLVQQDFLFCKRVSHDLTKLGSTHGWVDVRKFT